jgi:acyl-CoA synthetase (AMP-forming)/AMP-acid ligase II
MSLERLREIEARLTGPGGPFEVVPAQVLGEPMQVLKQRKRSLRQLLEESAAHGEKEYIVHGERRITYAQHLRQVASLAHAFRERYGIGPGDRVAILAENRPEWIQAFWASVSLGGIAAALNGWWTADEILYGVRHSDPKLLVIDRKRLARVAGRDLGVPLAVMEDDFPELLALDPQAALPSQPIAEDDPAVILYTSGTTGRPKGALNSHRGICGFVQLVMMNGLRLMLLAQELGALREENPPTPCALMTVPLFHLSGLYAGAVLMLASGAKTVWRSGRFDPLDALRLIEQERVTSWSGVGSMAYRVLHHPELAKFDLSSLRNLGTGGAPVSLRMQQRMREVAPTGSRALALGYGLSESNSTATLITGLELEERPTSAGRVCPTHQVEIRDPDDKPFPEGQQGEIHIRSPYLMLEYWRDPLATRKALKPGRWLATGDIGRFEDGYLYINSRARDMILRNAENVYPVEIEHRLEAHPAVAEVAVVGVDHEVMGQEVKAIVVPAAGAAIDPRELAAWVGETLAAYKVPSLWEVRSEPLPRNASGKVLKNVLTGEAPNRFVED